MLDKTIEQLCLRVNGILPYNVFTETFADSRIYPERNMKNTFCVKGGLIAFVTEELDYYVSPFADIVSSFLIRHGYNEKAINVPFLNGDTPSDKYSLRDWADICDCANRFHREQNSTKCR